MIGIIDADLLGRKKHRFPNLACEKIAGYWMENGKEVKLLQNYLDLDEFERVYISKVFTDTEIPGGVLDRKNVIYGGTGFFFGKAENLPDEIEHCMPFYGLYDDFIKSETEKGRAKQSSFKEYTDYSIGFLTRGCFRRCGFCVNQKYGKVFRASELKEFYDPQRKKLCFLDDNFFGIGKKQWLPILEEVMNTGRPFKFKQGLDERLLDDDICRILFSANYDSDFTFAFDNIEDYELIRQKLELIRKHTDNTRIRFYVLVGYKGTGIEDIEDALKRIALLMEYRCLPYIMRYQSADGTPWKNSEYKDMYIHLARWCNTPRVFKRMSFREYCEANQKMMKTNKTCASMRAFLSFKDKHPDLAEKYLDLKFI